MILSYVFVSLFVCFFFVCFVLFLFLFFFVFLFFSDQLLVGSRYKLC